MAQLAYMEGIPGEFITKASNDTEMVFKLLCGDLERFGRKQVHMLHLLAILSMAELQTFRVVRWWDIMELLIYTPDIKDMCATGCK